MNTTEHRVATYYSTENLYEAILAGLELAGKNPEALSVDDLAPVDAFHIRGREATKDLLKRVSPDEQTRVLDVGCGIGGTARFIAVEYGSHVTGLDLAAEFCEVAARLTVSVGLGDRVEFQQGSALHMPFEDERFDLAVSEHAQMNIGDKGACLREIARVLKRGGRLALYEICSGPQGAPFFPAPWAADASMSFLAEPEELRDAVRAAGLDVRHWRDVTDTSRTWFEGVMETVDQNGPPPVGVHLIMGSDARLKMQNIVRSLAEGRIAVVQAVCSKA